jgi:hypothetical protein
MTAMTFDTLASARRLKANGIIPEQAEAIAEEMRYAHDASRDALVTVSILEGKLAETKADIFKWMIPLQLGQYALLIGLLLKMGH